MDFGNQASMQPSEPIWRERGLRKRVLAGDADAWRALYEECFEPLYAYVHLRTGRRMDLTEEVVQECWMIAVQKIRKFRPERGTFESWLRGIADNVLRNYLRRLRRRQGTELTCGSELEPQAPVHPSSPSQNGVELAEQIAMVLTRLPARYQAVLRAKYEENLRVAEIAAQWGEPPKAIESLLSRARAAFREIFRRQDQEPKT